MSVVHFIFVQRSLSSFYRAYIDQFLNEMVVALERQNKDVESADQMSPSEMFSWYRDLLVPIRGMFAAYTKAAPADRLVLRLAYARFDHAHEQSRRIYRHCQAIPGAHHRRCLDGPYAGAERERQSASGAVDVALGKFGKLRDGDDAIYIAGWILRRETEGSLDLIVRVLDDLIPRLDRRAKATKAR